ncbi:ATP-dependent RNA helicase [uncultured Corynebacterium sp.]|uniref:ATP-dependent RNA helicase n=1 Tax=uncultured Corynebacterium sp. TaxID=159447 RepID=UPI00260BB565|nr:ATP-dependent helicase C-terminal domain-containing protein [uncultured Corynebacterium sp.]
MPSHQFDLATIGAGLPAAELLSRIPQRGPLVVEAPPGTGKTTLVPPALSNILARTADEATEEPPTTTATPATPPKVLVTAPRRVAVRAAARRLAHLDGSRVGDRVGYSIRGEHHPGTLVEFVTPGVLLNRLLADPALEGVGAVLIDEVHERQLDSDLVLAMCQEVALLREGDPAGELYLCAMSATVDTQKLADYMGAQVVSTPAVTHPLEVTYHPHPERAQGSPAFYRHVASLALQAHSYHCDSGHLDHRTLVFVPGRKEIDWVSSHLPDSVPLHGGLDSREQDAALTGNSPIVVATSIAESSLTVPGVHAVVDAGLSRTPRHDQARGMTGLVTTSTSKASADQRAGRAGRLGPGQVYRAYSAADYSHFAPDITPEILSSDLVTAALTLAAWGSPDISLLDAPPAATLTDANQELHALGALDGNGAITATGQKLARIPADPRLGAALLAHGSGAAEVVAALSTGLQGDLAEANPQASEVRRFARMVEDRGPATPGEVVASAFPDRVAKLVESSGRNAGNGGSGDAEYLLASGTRAILAPELRRPLGGSEWLAVAEVQLGRTPLIRAAARLDEPDLAQVREDVTARISEGKLRARRTRHLGAIELSSTPVSVSQLGEEEKNQAIAALAAEGLGWLRMTEGASRIKERVDYLREQLGEPWPDLAAGDYTPEAERVVAGERIADIDAYQAIMRQLPWPEAGRMDELAPERLEVPSGSSTKIHYETERPIVRIKLQECFGLAESPTIAGQKVLFHLLSPAGRELAVTDDLKSFWDGPYQGVRKDMRGRYPKHPWPEDPWSATATKKTKRALGS